MSFVPCVDHETLTRWQHDPAALVYTRRCARCGVVVERLTHADLVALDPAAVPLALVTHVTCKVS